MKQKFVIELYTNGLIIWFMEMSVWSEWQLHEIEKANEYSQNQNHKNISEFKLD